MMEALLNSGNMEYLAFSVPFLLFSADLYMHGPVDGPMKNVGLAASLVAVPLMRVEGFVIAELVWLALVVLAQMSAEKKAAEAAEAAAAAAAESSGAVSGPPTLPNEGVKKIDEGVNKFLENLGDKTCDGKEWKLVQDVDGIKVFSAEFPKQSIKRWKVVTDIQGPSVDALFRRALQL